MATAFRLRCSAAGSQEIYFDSLGMSPADAVAARAKISDVIEPLSRGRSAWQKLATIQSSLRSRCGLAPWARPGSMRKVSTDNPCGAGPWLFHPIQDCLFGQQLHSPWESVSRNHATHIRHCWAHLQHRPFRLGHHVPHLNPIPEHVRIWYSTQR